jgi:hypothetical protein
VRRALAILRGATFTVAAVGALVAGTMSALAASPSPGAAGGDPRSSGQGPGLVGDPAFALLAVVAIGVGSLVATLLYVRLTSRRDP